MSIIANIIWIIFGGLVTAIGWCLAGIVFSITIIGIPLGRQCFKMASLTLAPFGKTIVYGGGAPSLIANIFWLILAGLPWRFPTRCSVFSTASPSSVSPLASSVLRWRSCRFCPLARR